MKRVNIKAFSIAVILGASLSLGACKNKNKESDTKADTTTVQPSAPVATPVVISADDSLRNGVTDATKDYPGVKAEVSNGEITLTGDIERSRLQNLMQSLHSLRPKKINNNLKVK